MVKALTFNVNWFTTMDGNLQSMKETIGQRIRHARQLQGMETQQDLADAVGCKRATVTMWETDKVSSVGGNYLVALARALNVRPDWIQHGELPMRPLAAVSEPIHAYAVEATDGDEDFNPNQEVWVPDVEVTPSAGKGRVVPDFVETKYKQRYRLSWFTEKRVKPQNVRTMRVNGSSMERTLFDGDKIAVDFSDTLPKNGAVYVIAVGDEIRVKRLFKMADGRIRIASDNSDKETYPDEFITPEHMGTLAVFGRVIDKSGSGGL